MSIEDDIRRIVREELDKRLEQSDWVTIYRAPEYHPSKSCSRCGLDWKVTMGHCCGDPACPLGVVTLAATTTDIDGVKLS